MNKHAFLIIAHKNDLTFNTLIKLLDHPNNDIFIHMDKKLENYNPKLLESQIMYSNIYHVPRTDVRWGGYSQINAELLLLKNAYSINKYVHYHLLSGEDLPIKSMEAIHSFFEENTGKNFLQFESSNFQHDYRVRYYHFFQDIVGRGNKLTRVANKLFVKLQQVLGVYRHKDIEFQKGSNWFSINAELTRYVIENEYKIKEIFSNTFCCDEVYMQTLVHNTHFKNSLYHQDYDNELKSIMRYIDWERGQPYIFREIDFFDLLDSPYLFARKFNSEVDESVINKVARHIYS